MQKILIVEDDIDIQDILKNHLIDAGYEVAVASDGVSGIAMFGDTIDLEELDKAISDAVKNGQLTQEEADSVQK